MARFDIGQVDACDMSSALTTGEAYYELGLMYAAGRNQAPDLIAAHKWLNVAVARGYAEAALRRAELSAEMTREQIAAAQREARVWLTRH